MARPIKLTAEIRDLICTELRAGNTRAESARSAGIGGRTFKRWMARGEAPFPDFRRAVLEAEAFGYEHGPLAMLRKLARRFPDLYGGNPARRSAAPVREVQHWFFAQRR